MFKINNLVDNELIDDLYCVSQVGVKICGIVCGMCSLCLGIKGLSENIKIIFVVDCFLEYFWVMIFNGGGNCKVYILLVDWMMCNMDNCIEVGVLVYDDVFQ